MQPNHTRIRLYHDGDLPAIVAIYNASIPSRTATADLTEVTVQERESWQAEHNATSRPLYVAETEGVISAFLSVQDFYPRAAYTHTVEIGLYVHPDYRCRGIATNLLKQLEAEADDRKIHTITAFIFAHNKDSIHLFTRLRFEEWGKLPSVASLDGKLADLLIFGKNVRVLPASMNL